MCISSLATVLSLSPSCFSAMFVSLCKQHVGIWVSLPRSSMFARLQRCSAPNPSLRTMCRARYQKTSLCWSFSCSSRDAGLCGWSRLDPRNITVQRNWLHCSGPWRPKRNKTENSPFYILRDLNYNWQWHCHHQHDSLLFCMLLSISASVSILTCLSSYLAPLQTHKPA